MLASSEVRPTTDRVREALFSSLTSLAAVEGVSVLDLYAGSGAFGFEALSRGAKSCCFVEKYTVQAAQIRNLAARFGVEAQCEVVNADVLHFLSRERLANGRRFELVFADPPYSSHPGPELLRLLAHSCLLAEGALVLIEAGREGEDIAAAERFEALKIKAYGRTVVAYFRFLGGADETSL